MKRKSQFRVPRFEGLENRQLLAADFGHVDDAGVLTILGTPKNDRINVSYFATDGAPVGQIVVKLNGQTTSFDPTGLTGLKIDGGAGNDVIEISDQVSLGATILGGKGNDRIKGGGGNDQIEGNEGNDRLEGGAGDDSVLGGSGEDRLGGNGGSDSLDGGTGNDWLNGDDGDDSLLGATGNDHLAGGVGKDAIFAGLGNDDVNGGDGDDTLHGDDGNDRVAGADGDDQIFGDRGHDKLFGGVGKDALKGGQGDDLLDGGTDDDLLDGDEGKNKLVDGTSIDFEQELIASLTISGQTGVFGRAKFEAESEDGTLENSLVIVVENAPPGSATVKVDDQLIGLLTVGPDGRGKLKFTDHPEHEGDLAFPTGVNVKVGSTILIEVTVQGGDSTSTVLITGTFAVETSDS